jgi:hypothetical protein
VLGGISSFEFLFSGNALLGALVFLLPTALAVLALRQRRIIYWVGFAASLILTGALWWNLAREEERRAKPERDYVYFFVRPDSEVSADGKTILFYRSTGILDGVKICVDQTFDYWNNGERAALCWPSRNFDENGGPFALVGMDDYTFDSDARTNLGKIREHLNIVQNHGRVVVLTMEVRRKTGGEILCAFPPRPGVRPCL